MGHDNRKHRKDLGELNSLIFLTPQIGTAMSSLRPGMNKELLGILVSYKVRVNLMLSYGG